MALRRLKRELQELHLPNAPVGVYEIEPLGDNLFFWHGCIFGPDDSLYKGGKFNISIQINSDYPFSPPLVKFETKIYHPNINATGAICLDILKPAKWSPF